MNLIGDCQGGWLSVIYAALRPESVHTLTIAGAPVDFHAGGAVIHGYVQALGARDLRFYEDVVRLGGGVMKGEFMLNGFIALKPESEVAKQLELLANIHDPDHVLRHRAFEDWFKHTQDIPGAFYLWIVERLFRDNALIRGELRRRRARRPASDPVPVEPPGRRDRPHHTAAAGLRARRRRLDARRRRDAAGHEWRASRPLHGPRGAARLLAGDRRRHLHALGLAE